MQPERTLRFVLEQFLKIADFLVFICQMNVTKVSLKNQCCPTNLICSYTLEIDPYIPTDFPPMLGRN